MNILSRTIVGYLDPLNKTSIDWSLNNIIAYGCQTTIVLFDPQSLEIIQTLDPRKGLITKLKWLDLKCKLMSGDETSSVSETTKVQLKLASGDDLGNLAIWDVSDGCVLNEFNEHQTPIQDLKWISHLDNNGNEYLLVLYTVTNNLVLYNATTGAKVWSKLFTEAILQIAIDPHIDSRVALLSPTCIQFLEDFSVQQTTNTNQHLRRFHITNSNNQSDEATAKTKNQQQQQSSWFRSLVDNTSTAKQDAVTQDTSLFALNDCLQIEFHPLHKNLLFVVYPKDIFIFDLIINQTIGYIPLDRSNGYFSQVYICSENDQIYCLHDNCTISVRIRVNRSGALSNTDDYAYETLQPHDYQYDMHAQSDHIKVMKMAKTYGFYVSPLNESTLVVLLNDGRLLFHDYSPANKKLYLNNVYNCNLPQLPFVARICPAMTKKNWAYYESLIAIGCSNGDLYVYKLGNNIKLWRKYTVHTYGIRGIEWVTLKSVLTWSNNGQNNTNSMSTSSSMSNIELAKTQLVKNEILFTDLMTGQVKTIRQDISHEESPIASIKTSYLKQYFIIIFKEQPLEIWDLKTFTIIRKLSHKSPIITILEWSPSFKKTVLHKDDQKQRMALASQSSDQSSGGDNVVISTDAIIAAQTQTTNDVIPDPDKDHQQHVIQKENFFCIDNSGLMYSFYVEGHTIKDSSKVLLEDGNLINVISLALKHDYIVFGDENGDLNIWDLKSKISKTIHNKRGPIRKIKFAPGKENLRLLILYGANVIEIFDLNKYETISVYRAQTQKEKILDCDWCTSDKPFLVQNDGSIHIVDINLKQLPNQLNYLKLNNLFKPSFQDVSLIKTFSKNEYFALKFVLYDAIRLSYTYDTLKVKKNAFFLNELHLQANLNDLVENLNDSLVGILDRPGELIAKFFDLTKCLYPYCEFELKFWSILMYYMDSSQFNRKYIDYHYFNSKKFRLNEMKHLKLYEVKHTRSGAHGGSGSGTQALKFLINDLLLCNETDKVFNLLLETESSTSTASSHGVGNYLFDYIYACLINSLKINNFTNPTNDIHIANAKSSIKLVATNLIANGKLQEGVQLLCLIGLVNDACRYLQDNNQWEKAFWLAKMRLSDDELNEVVKRWTDYLCLPNINRKNFAILLLLSCGQFGKTIEIMSTIREHRFLTLLFLQYCSEQSLIKIIDTKESLSKTQQASNCISKNLFEKIHADNARIFYKLDNMEAFKQLCEQAGELGESLLSS